MFPSLALPLATILLGAIDPVPSGRWIDLPEARVFLPEGYRPINGKVDLVVHLHGAEGVAARALAEAGWPAVLIVVNRKGLSSAYAEPFEDEGLFPRILDGAIETVRREGQAGRPEFGRVVVSAFSAGFGGVRELLEVPAHFDRIDALVLADSLYCGYAADGRTLDPEKMAGFRRFAAEAADGRKALLVTHSAQVPEGYASTTETADDLIRHVGGRPEPADDDWGDGWRLVSRFERGRSRVLGFAGAGPEDHLRHLRRLGEIWRALPAP